MNAPINRDLLIQLLADHQAPCLSLYQPTHRAFPDRQQDPIRFRNLVEELQRSLEKTHSEESIAALLRPFRELQENEEFWTHNLEGLAVFGGPDLFRVFRLQRRVPALAVVAQSFHLKPLVRINQSAERYQVLCLDRNKVRLFEGSRDALDEVDLADSVPRTLEDALGTEMTDKNQSGLTEGFSGPGERGRAMRHGPSGKQDDIDMDRDRYFLAVDKAITECHSRPSGLPLILAALPEYKGHFHRISHNPYLLPHGIDLNPGALNVDQLREQSWKVMQPQFQKRLEGFIEEYGESVGHGLGSDDPVEIGHATIENRVSMLLVEADRHLPGRLDPETGDSQPAKSEDPNVDDLLDDLMECTLKHGGEVLVVPPERMPSKTGVAAIYRF